ncbi:MreB-like protein [bioreactor metagenome]|uniref:MreB-like protein n=1 Tax=bioreactor metagenome TaxID=1076179 RepID=A0A645J7C4_9ZZZZ
MATELTATVRGRNLITGLPGSVEVSSIEIREAISASVKIIIDTIRDALDEVPPELVSDLLDSGICLAGGGSQILGLVPRLAEELNLRVWIADDPMTCVARGAGIVLENLDLYEKFLVDLDRPSN